MKRSHSRSPRKIRARTKVALSPLKAQIRANSASHQVVSAISKQSTLPELVDVLDWYVPRYRFKEQLLSLRPKAPWQLPHYIHRGDGSFEDQVRWTVATATVYAQEIRSHNSNIDLENRNISDYSKFLDESLNELNNVMWSFSAVSQTLFATSIKSGLEIQRKWLHTSGYVSKPSISNLILYSKGIACEGDRHPHDIFEILNKYLYNLLPNEDLNLFLYVLTFSPILHRVVYERLIAMFAYFPVVDQYEALVNVATSGHGYLTADALPYQVEILQLMTDVGDWRSTPLSRLQGIYKLDRIQLPLISKPVSVLLESLGVADHLETPSDRAFDILLTNEFSFQAQSPRGFLASSLYALKTSDTLEEVVAALSRRSIATLHFEPGLDPLPEKISYQFDELKRVMGSARSVFEKRELFRISCLCGLAEGRVHDVLVLLYEFTSFDPLGAAYFPSTPLLQLLSEEEIAGVGADPRVAVALSRTAFQLGEEGENLIYLAVEQCLSANRLFKPSELSASNRVYIDFLFEACNTTTLRQSLEFISREEMEEERIIILFNLEVEDPENEEIYLAEVHDIIGQQTIDELLKRFHVGKVQCDEEALAKWAASDLLPKFSRLKDFIDAGLLPVERNADAEFLAHLTSGTSETFTFKVPNSESLDIARSILSELVQRYALDPRYGVDSYLSLGMRHGAVAEHLRSPLLAENILTSKGLTGYPDDCFWREYYLDDGQEDYGDAIGPILARFSEAFDNKLELVKEDLLQVRRPEKPKGLIVADWTEATLLSMSSRFAEVADFSDFLSEFSTIFWANVESKLVDARQYIETDLSKELTELLDDLEEDIRKATGRPRLSPFSDAVMRARQELANSIRDVASWHNVARSTDVEPLGLIDIISAAQKIVTRLYPEFQPRVQFSGDTAVSLTYSLHILIEVFKALFTNVYDHSGSKAPSIEVTVTVISDLALGVDFTSDCIDIDKAEQAAADNNEKIRTGEYEKKLPKEGGSGLAKVARSTVRDGKPNTIVSVDRPNSRFGVSMIFNLVNL